MKLVQLFLGVVFLVILSPVIAFAVTLACIPLSIHVAACSACGVPDDAQSFSTAFEGFVNKLICVA